MSIGASIFLAAVGAILRYAVTIPANQNGFNIHTGGVILMIAGGVGLLLSMLFWNSNAPFNSRNSVSRREQTTTRDGVEQGTVVRETRDHVSS
ncbi:MAG TPA: hypothetical protein VI541_03740 [Actinomycetota bacterium]|nr:hypothetical protein [Actinomycetota bacterium]